MRSVRTVGSLAIRGSVSPVNDNCGAREEREGNYDDIPGVTKENAKYMHDRGGKGCGIGDNKNRRT